MKSLVTVGGAGALGRAIVRLFSQEFRVLSIDFKAPEGAQHAYILDAETGLEQQQVGKISAQIQKDLNAQKRGVDCLICAAGGFQMGSGKDSDILEKWATMSAQLVEPSLLTYHLATKYLKPKGLCIFTGAYAAFKDTAPDMLAYHTGKVATHSIALNLARSQEAAGQEGASIVTILPEMIRTEANEQAMPEINWQEHPSGEQIAELLLGWERARHRPVNGAMARLKLSGGVCVPEFL